MLDPVVIIVVAMAVLVGLLLALVGSAQNSRRLRTRLSTVTGQSVPGAPALDEDPDLPRLVVERRGSRLPAVLDTVLRKLDRALASTGYALRPLHVVLTGALGAAAVYALTGRLMHLDAAVVALLAVAAALLLPMLLVRHFRGRHQTRFLNLFPDAIDLIVRAIKAGLPVSEAVATVGKEVADPVGGEFRRIADEMHIGIDIAEAMDRAAERIGLADFRFFVASLALQRETGGSLAETLENLSNIIRKRKELRLKTRALTSEARASAMIIGALPFFAGGMLALINPDYLSRLFDDPRGSYILGIAIVSLLSGVLVMRTIIKRSLA